MASRYHILLCMAVWVRIGRLVACAGSSLWFEAGGMGLSGVIT